MGNGEGIVCSLGDEQRANGLLSDTFRLLSNGSFLYTVLAPRL